MKVGEIWRNKRSKRVVRIDEIRTIARVPVVRFSGKPAMPRRVFIERYTLAVCPQCGQVYSARACGPSHAVVAMGGGL